MKEMEKARKKEIKEMGILIKEILSSTDNDLKSDAAKIKALLIIHNFQTTEEQKCGQTVENNGVGFTGFDGDILTSFSQQLYNTISLSPRQMEVVRKRIKKYWKQITQVSINKSTPSNIDKFMEMWINKNKYRYATGNY